MMNKQRLPHFITVVSFVVFIILGLACASTPSSSQSSSSSTSKSTTNSSTASTTTPAPNSSAASTSAPAPKNTENVIFEIKKETVNGVQIERMYIGIREKDEFQLMKGPASTGIRILLLMDASKNATGIQNSLNRRWAIRQDHYFVSEGDFILIIEGKEFSLKSGYQKINSGYPEYNIGVISKNTELSAEILRAITGCTTLQIGYYKIDSDMESFYKSNGLKYVPAFIKELEITGDGLTSIKNFIRNAIP